MSADTLLRHWSLLQAVPRHRKATAQELMMHLRREGFDVSERTVQRDLIKLSRICPIEADERSRPFGWRYARAAPAVDIPAMAPATALSLQVAQALLQPVMPPATLEALAPYLRRAERLLEECGSSARSWPDKIRILSGRQPLIAPEIDAEVLEVVCQAVLGEHCLVATYRGRGSVAASGYQVQPLGMVYRDGAVYLVCTLFEQTEVRHLALHRMVAATPLPDAPVRVPDGFCLDRYIGDAKFGIPGGGAIALEARFAPEAGLHLGEFKLSPDQTCSVEPDGWTRVRARVVDSRQLRCWLRGFGADVEVLGPEALRAEFVAEARRLAERYIKEQA